MPKLLWLQSWGGDTTLYTFCHCRYLRCSTFGKSESVEPYTGKASRGRILSSPLRKDVSYWQLNRRQLLLCSATCWDSTHFSWNHFFFTPVSPYLYEQRKSTCLDAVTNPKKEFVDSSPGMGLGMPSCLGDGSRKGNLVIWSQTWLYSYHYTSLGWVPWVYAYTTPEWSGLKRTLINKQGYLANHEIGETDRSFSNTSSGFPWINLFTAYCLPRKWRRDFKFMEISRKSYRMPRFY